MYFQVNGYQYQSSSDAAVKMTDTVNVIVNKSRLKIKSTINMFDNGNKQNVLCELYSQNTV